jgi:hypothetical protein
MKKTIISKAELEVQCAALIARVAELESKLATYAIPVAMPQSFRDIPDNPAPYFNASYGKRATPPGPVESYAITVAQSIAGGRCNPGGKTVGERERNSWRWLERHAPHRLPGGATRNPITDGAGVATVAGYYNPNADD